MDPRNPSADPNNRAVQLVNEVETASNMNPAQERQILLDAIARASRMTPRSAEEARDLPQVLRAFRQLVARPPSVSGLGSPLHDDFDDDVRRQIIARTDQGDDMWTLARARQLKHIERPIQRVSIAPKVEAGMLGNSGLVVYGPTTAQMQAGYVQETELVQWQEEKHASQAFTVDAEILTPPPPNVLSGAGAVVYSSRPYLKIWIRCDRYNGIPILVDIGQGVRITGAGSAVQVNAGQAAPSAVVPSGQQPIASAPIQVGARMGFFSANNSQPPTYTLYVDGLGVGASTTLARPAGAQRLYALLGDAGFTNASLSYLDSIGNTVWGPVSFSPAQLPVILPLTGDCTQILLTNNGQAPATFRLPFLIYL